MNNKYKIINILLQSTIVVVCIEFYVLKLWQADLSVPFTYQGDALWFVVPVKGMIDNGWVYEIPQLSAPFGLSAAGFPSMTNFDWLIMKGISLFVNDAGAVLNIFWLLSIVLTAWSAAIALYFLGAKSWLALSAAIMYAFLPYAFLRNIGHISLVYYTVPLLALLAINIAKGSSEQQPKLVKVFCYGAAIAQGFNYIYFSFFAVVLFIFSGLLGFLRTGSKKPIKEAVLAVFIIIFIASINLVPSFHSWSKHGRPPDMGYKSASEAEVYGLKLRKLLVPHESNEFPFLSQWAKRDKAANFPNENENVTARLGPMAAIGFLLLLFISFRMSTKHASNGWSDINIVASLSLLTFLFTSVGGFGAIVNQIVPDIRGYNRFSVFIAFFSLVGLVLVWQKICIIQKTNSAKYLFVAVFCAVGVFSLYDQLLDADHLVNRRESDINSANELKRLVKYIETEFPDGVSVFQLPPTGFPPDGGKERMLPYDHARPYLWSNNINWSWPSFSQRHRNWLDQLVGMEGGALAEAVVLSKFGLIWVDRYGYSDNGTKMVASLLAAGAIELASGSSRRYVILNLAPVSQKLSSQLGAIELQRRSEIFLNAPSLNWNNGFYGLENNQDGRFFRWSLKNSQLVIENMMDSTWTGSLSFYVASGSPGKLKVSSEQHGNTVMLGHEPVHVHVRVKIEPNSRSVITFASEAAKMVVPSAESRDLYFYIMDWRLISQSE